jgi:adenosine deaminase
MHEDEPYELLREMASRGVMVEICLTSNDVILGVSREQHPLAVYLEYDVPVALATDDEGISRSEISREYLRAAEEHGLGYIQLKKMARTSLHYAFLPDGSLWRDAQKFLPVAPCANDMPGGRPVSGSCQQYLAGSEKARLQWKLEEDLRAFESAYGAH